MKKEENIMNFDLSSLELSELIDLYDKTHSFLDYLDGQKIAEADKEEENDG